MNVSLTSHPVSGLIVPTDILSATAILKPAPSLGAPVLTLNSGAGAIEVSTTVPTAGRYVAYNDGDTWLELLVGTPAVPVLIPPFDCRDIVTLAANATITAAWQDSGLPWGRPFRVDFNDGTNRTNSTWDANTGTVRKSGGTASWADHYQYATNASLVNSSDALAYLMPISAPGAYVEIGFGGTVNVYATAVQGFRASNSAGAYGSVQWNVNGGASTATFPVGSVVRMGIRNAIATQEFLMPGQPPRLMHMALPSLSYPLPLNIGLLTPGQMWGPVYAQRRAFLQLFNPAY